MNKVNLNPWEDSFCEIQVWHNEGGGYDLGVMLYPYVKAPGYVGYNPTCIFRTAGPDIATLIYAAAHDVSDGIVGPLVIRLEEIGASSFGPTFYSAPADPDAIAKAVCIQTARGSSHGIDSYPPCAALV